MMCTLWPFGVGHVYRSITAEFSSSKRVLRVKQIV